jgi:hypothetical protein
MTADTAAPGAAPAPDTSDMAAVHRVYREALDAAPRLVGEVPDSDTDRVGVVGSYYYNVLRFLEVHHDGEDHLVTPLLVERCAPAEVDEVTRVAAQHKSVEGPLHESHAAVSTWREDGSAVSAKQLVAALGTLQSALVPHLDEEEEKIVPLAAAHMSAEEWGALPGHGLAKFQGDNIWLILGLIREQMNDMQRQMMLEHMPPPVADAWRNTGEAEFTAFITEVRSSL